MLTYTQAREIKPDAWHPETQSVAPRAGLRNNETHRKEMEGHKMTGTIYKTLFAVIDELIADTQDAFEIHGSRTTTRSRGQPQQR